MTCFFDGLIPLEGKAASVCSEPPASQICHSLVSLQPIQLFSSSFYPSSASLHLLLSLMISLSCFAKVLQIPSQYSDMTNNELAINTHEWHRKQNPI